MSAREAKSREAQDGSFIAVQNCKTLASAGTHGELVEKLKKMGINLGDVTFEHVRPKDRPCAY